MSTQNEPQTTSQSEQQAQAQATLAAPAPPSAAAAAPVRGLPTFLKISIILLAALSIASISLLFIGDFEGKFERVFSTFIAFAVFVALTAFDTRRGQRNEWYPPVALLANSYILALLLVVIWMTPAGWSLGWDIFWKSLVVILVTRAVVACAQVLLHMAENRPKPLGVFALITSLLATVTGILFTAPIAIEVFNVEVPELYWRFAVAGLLLTGLGLSIALLLRWSYGGADREAARRARQAAALAHREAAASSGAGAAPGIAGGQAAVAPHGNSYVGVQPLQPQPVQGQPVQAQPVQAQPVQAQPVQAQPQPLLPWPTYPDGRPLPVAPNGQPDFSALGR